MGGASLRALAAARVFECPRCKENVRPGPKPVARTPRYSRFGQCVGLDFANFPDMNGTMHTAVVMVDIASDKTVVKYVDGCINQKPTSL